MFLVRRMVRGRPHCKSDVGVKGLQGPREAPREWAWEAATARMRRFWGKRMPDVGRSQWGRRRLSECRMWSEIPSGRSLRALGDRWDVGLLFSVGKSRARGGFWSRAVAWTASLGRGQERAVAVALIQPKMAAVWARVEVREVLGFRICYNGGTERISW